MEYAEIQTQVRKLWQKVCADEEKAEDERLQKALKEYRDPVLRKAPRRVKIFNTLLPSTNSHPALTENTRNKSKVVRYKVREQFQGKDSNQITVHAIQLPVSEPAIPIHQSCVVIDNVYAVPDNNVLTYVPASLADDFVTDGDPNAMDIAPQNPSDDIFSMYDTSHRERQIQYGPGFEQTRINASLDRVLQLCLVNNSLRNEILKGSAEIDTDLIQCIADVTKTDSERVLERYQHCSLHLMPTNSVGIVSQLPAPTGETEVAADPQLAIYLKAMSSYRLLYCRRCFTFDCNKHGLQEKPSPTFQYEFAKALEIDGTKTTSKISSLSQPSEGGKGKSRPTTLFQLTESQKILCRRLYLIWDGDLTKIAATIRVSLNEVSHFAQQEQLQVPSRDLPIPQRKKVGGPANYYSARNYNQIWYSQIEKAEIHPAFEPCVHEEPCWDGICRCVDNHFFCTKACAWSWKSPNFFRGCGCKGNCSSSSCTCFATKRECDPDLCSCQTCCDPPNKRISNQQCHNDNLTMRRHTHLMLAPSSIKNAGWGCFSKYSLRKGEYIHEYVGELISQEEADRRGQLYDQQNQSSLFNLNSETVIDANRKGNITRFLNHSSNPNCEARTMFVNGDYRIGFFATKDIDAENELFFDYQYNKVMDNRFIIKTANEAPWMKAGNEKATASTKKR